LEFIKDVIGINLGSMEDDVIENLLKMFKQKKIRAIISWYRYQNLWIARIWSPFLRIRRQRKQ
jgi:hypothetical protein